MSAKRNIVSILGFLLLSCAGSQVSGGADLGVEGRLLPDSEAKPLFELVRKISRNAPETLSATFTVEANMKNKKYKSLANASYIRDQRKMSISFIDFIFKSPLTSIYQEGDAVRIYFPAEKRLFVDNIRRMKLSNYTEIGMDFYILHDLIAGRIPLSDRATLRKAMYAEKTGQHLLILEGGGYYELVVLKKNVPVRLVLVNKSSKERYEFNLSRPVRKGESLYFQQIDFRAPAQGVSVEIRFSRLVLNGAVKVDSFKDVKLPSDVQIHQM